jgi:hypothetical protein
MKKLTRIFACLLWTILLSGIIATPIFAQVPVTQIAKPGIPAEVMKILQKSCAKCHIDGQSAGLKFTEWSTYTPEKQASRARAMCSEVTKGFMPPNNFQKKNPDAVPTQADIKTICDWATTLQPPKK